MTAERSGDLMGDLTSGDKTSSTVPEGVGVSIKQMESPALFVSGS